MLLNMGFDGSNAVTAARIFGSDVSAAVNYLTSQPPPESAFYHPQPTYNNNVYDNNNNNNKQTTTNNNNKNNNNNNNNNNANSQKKNKTNMSPDDIAIDEFLARIGKQIQDKLDEDEIMDSAVKYINEMDAKKKEQEKPKEYVPKSKEELEYDEKTNEQIKNITKRLSLSKDQLQSQVMK